MRQESANAWSQASTRRPQRYTDNHGRRWSASVEKATGDPAGLIRANFSAPWYPDQAYLVIDKHDRSKIVIDYDRMLRDRLEAHESYARQAIEEAASRQWTIEDDEHGRPVYDRKLLQIIGQPPKPVEPIVAAMQGNKFILGLSAKADPRLLPFLPNRESKRQAVIAALPDFSDDAEVEIDTDEEPLTYTEFVSAKRREGLSMQDISKSWKAYKAGLATVGG